MRFPRFPAAWPMAVMSARASRRAPARHSASSAAAVQISNASNSNDARKKSNVHFTLSALVNLASEVDEADLLSRLPDRDRKRVRAADADDPSCPAPVQDGLCEPRPVVVGAGCAGIFASLTLSEECLRPILLERGDDATRRTEAVGQ